MGRIYKKSSLFESTYLLYRNLIEEMEIYLNLCTRDTSLLAPEFEVGTADVVNCCFICVG
jgi:hypothetical protein